MKKRRRASGDAEVPQRDASSSWTLCRRETYKKETYFLKLETRRDHHYHYDKDCYAPWWVYLVVPFSHSGSTE